MRHPVRFTAPVLAAAALALSLAGRAQAQSPTANQTTNGVPYEVINPLAGVRYDNRFDVSVGAAYDHMKAGPTLLQGSNLGGLDISGSYWLLKNWGLEGSGRIYLGTSGSGNSNGPTGGNAQNNIKGPFVSEYFFTAGPEWLGPHNEHGDLMAHVLVGGVYGDFQKDLLGQPASVVAFYNNQIAPAIIVGGHMDLNRSARLVFRITPDATITHYSINYAPYTSQFDVNFAISVGLEYKFKKKR
jgi:hypothetical protein